MCEGWHIISNTGSELPASGQIIYCCIAEGNTISTVRPVVCDLKYFEDLLYLHPKWIILWQPLPPLPKPPSLSAVLSHNKEVLYG